MRFPGTECDPGGPHPALQHLLRSLAVRADSRRASVMYHRKHLCFWYSSRLIFANFFNVIRTIVFITAFSLCVSALWAKDEKSIQKLRDALVALAPDVDPVEAELLSVTAHTTSRNLAREYHLALSPIFQNFLITMGKRQRGWCGHYTRDIGEC